MTMKAGPWIRSTGSSQALRKRHRLDFLLLLHQGKSKKKGCPSCTGTDVSETFRKQIGVFAEFQCTTTEAGH